MVTRENQHTRPRRFPQGSKAPLPVAYKISAATPYDFEGKDLNAFRGLLPVATMLDKLDFQPLVEETLRVKLAQSSRPPLWAAYVNQKLGSIPQEPAC